MYTSRAVINYPFIINIIWLSMRIHGALYVLGCIIVNIILVYLLYIYN